MGSATCLSAELMWSFADCSWKTLALGRLLPFAAKKIMVKIADKKAAREAASLTDLSQLLILGC